MVPELFNHLIDDLFQRRCVLVGKGLGQGFPEGAEIKYITCYLDWRYIDIYL